MFLLLHVLAYLSICSCYKIAIFAPAISNSQLGWNKRVAEELARAGHDVTIVVVQTMEDAEDDVKFSPEVNVYQLNASSGLTRSAMETFQKDAVFGDVTFWHPSGRKHMELFMGMLLDGCKLTLQNKKFMQWLTDQKFDVAFSHMYHTCPIGIIHAAKIPAWIWLNSGQLMDNVAHVIGVPTFPSYVPPLMMDSSDEMDFFQRTKSFIGHALYMLMWPWLVPNKETQIFREYWDEKFPDILELARKCPLVMVNSNELYELPRPTLAKVVNIGGLGVEHKDAKPLKGEFKEIAEGGKGMIVMSFGSVAHAELMPEQWKTALLEAFAHFPDYEFLMRYGGDDLKDRLPPNVHAYRWLPQADLLLHSSTRAFISHGGYNSLQESINSGVPLITIPLFGDQFKNSRIAVKHGFAINVNKATLSKSSVVEALHEILSNEKYTQNAKRLSLMVRKKPVSPGYLLVRWTEFLAEFQTLDNLAPAGNDLYFFQYFSLDVISCLLFVAILILFAGFKVLRIIVRRVFSIGRKEKHE